MITVANAKVTGHRLLMGVSARRNNKDVQNAMKTLMVIGVLFRIQAALQIKGMDGVIVVSNFVTLWLYGNF